jgi:hypothetical protein
MHVFSSSARLPFVALVFFSGLAYAELSTEARLGTGPERYRSYQLGASADLPMLPINLDVKRFVAYSQGTQIADEKSAGLNWTPTDWLLASAHHRDTEGDILNTRGEDYALSVNIAPLWKGSLGTHVDLGYGTLDYRAATGRPLVRRALNRRLPQLDRESVGIAQDLGETWGVSFNVERYRYDKDPVDVARSILRRVRRPNNTVFELVSFPDRSAGLGLHWQPDERWSVDLSRQRTITVLDQKQESTRLDLNYRPIKRFEIGASATHSRSTALLRPNGATAVEASSGNYYELGGRLFFD